MTNVKLKMQVNTVAVTNKIVLGFSGGVDSTAAALLLKEKGYEVLAVYLDIFGVSSPDTDKTLSEAVKAAHILGIPLEVLDVSTQFKNIVIQNFCSEYASGRTPNPCIICNPNVKFHFLNEIAEKENSLLATGHYARIFSIMGTYYVQKGKNIKKDQSYVLYRLPQHILRRTIFPLGEIEDKSKLREMLKTYGIFNHDKKDSQEICFISDDEPRIDFLKKHGYRLGKGAFIDCAGRDIGTHKGISEYTIGQRKGLGLSIGHPVFVCEINSHDNTVKVGEEGNLFSDSALCKDAHFMLTDSSRMPENLARSKKLKAKIRYAANPVSVNMEQLKNDDLLIHFDSPQRALTPGQSLVLYIDDLVIGGAIIN